MAGIDRISLRLMALAALCLGIVFPAVRGQAPAPVPAPAPTSDGTAIDQGVAYLLMFVALILTYVIHPSDAFPLEKLF